MTRSTRELVPFLPATPFVEANHDAIDGIFDAFSRDFPDRTVEVDGETLATAEALRIDDGSLPESTRKWLWHYTMGAQHGYDRGTGGKIYIPHDDPRYMGHVAALQAGPYNFVTGGQPEGGVNNRNIIIGGGFPHLNASRFRAALSGDHNNLWDVASANMMAGQRRRWNNNENEATGETVIARTAEFTGFDPDNSSDQKKLERWRHQSRFAREQDLLTEGVEWYQPYATEAEMARLALELAMLRTDDGLFDWEANPVTEHEDSEASELVSGDFWVPPRRTKAWEYHTTDGRSFFVVNGAAVLRPNGGEPRPTSQSVMREGYAMLSDTLQEHETVIGFGAPHVRAGYDTAIGLLDESKGNVAPIHLSVGDWETHEPPVSGLTIVDMYKADRRLRALVDGKDPNSPELVSL